MGLRVNALRLGLESSPSQSNLLVFLENLSPTPQDLFVAFVDVQGFEFTATAPNGKEYSIKDPLLYRPCAGLCGLPFTERLNSGATRKSQYDLEKLLFTPPKGQYTTLRILLHRGYSIRAS